MPQLSADDIYARKAIVVDEGLESADSSEVYTSIDFTKLRPA
jgi:hypothetical protein